MLLSEEEQILNTNIIMLAHVFLWLRAGNLMNNNERNSSVNMYFCKH